MFTINKNSKKILILVLSLIASVMLIIGIALYFFPGYEDSSLIIVKGESEAGIVYSVMMDENPIYDDRAVSDEKYYLKPFTGYLDVECYLNVITDVDAHIECTSEVYGLLISEITAEDGKDIVWEKRYNYSAQQSKSIEGQSLDVTRRIFIDLDNYEELTTMLIEDYNILTDYYLRIVFESEITIFKNEKSEMKLLKTYLDVPFIDNVMEIKNSSPTFGEILIEEDVLEKKEANKDLVFLFLVLFIASLLSLVIVIFRTKGIDKKDIFKNKIEKIFKEYGNRLAGLTDTLTYHSSTMISIDKMEDMVKIADEIGQTIFYYRIDEVEERKIEFYVFDEGRIYYLVIFGTLT